MENNFDNTPDNNDMPKDTYSDPNAGQQYTDPNAGADAGQTSTDAGTGQTYTCLLYTSRHTYDYRADAAHRGEDG